jgi:hypothetical protein
MMTYYIYNDEGFFAGTTEDPNTPRITDVPVNVVETDDLKAAYADRTWVLLSKSEYDAQKAANELAAVEAARKQNILTQITALEATITNRRIREAQISGDMSFIAGVDAQIAVLRGTL